MFASLTGTYRGLDYLVYFYKDITEDFMCGYVKLPDGHPYIQFIVNDTMGYEAMDIDCPGGLIYSKEITKEDLAENGDWKDAGFTPGYWIGWDYPWSEYYTARTFSGDRGYGAEVVRDCKGVIDQLIKKGKVKSKTKIRRIFI